MNFQVDPRISTSAFFKGQSHRKPPVSDMAKPPAWSSANFFWMKPPVGFEDEAALLQLQKLQQMFAQLG
jgi:hypothetical protein